ncbi:hypothetical protein VPH35_070841 [Triticum aestivum]
MTPQSSAWADLLPDLLLDISGRLHAVTDYVCFHAVCKPWRAIAGRRSPTTRPTFPPWLLGLCNENHIIHCRANFPCVSAFKASIDRDFIVEEPRGTSSAGAKGANWVARADGMAASVFAASPDPRLINLLTGAVTPLPRFPDDDAEMKRSMENVHGVIYDDGTIFLYNPLYTCTRVFTIAVLRPGDATWTVMKTNLEAPNHHSLCVAYHNGKVLWRISMRPWFLLTQDGIGGSVRCDPVDKIGYIPVDSYILESHGKLLCATILVHVHWFHDIASSMPEMLVIVQTLEEEAGDEMRWVTDESQSFDDRVLFLGYPTSCAMDATQMDMLGGCAYFVFQHNLLRYSFVNNEIKTVEYNIVRPTDYGARVWLQPQPPIAPIHDIQERLWRLGLNKEK